MKEKTISSFDEFFEYIEPFKGKFYFRGQKSKEWKILPTLFRDGNMKDFSVERSIIETIIRENPKLQPLEALYSARHHGESTRICDLTISPLNALCFASDIGTADDDDDGVVFVVDKSESIALGSLEVRLFSSVLTGDSRLNSIATESLSDILTKNYIIDHKDFIYGNARAFRQGGTGIIFGFGIENGVLTPIGSVDVDNLIVEKIFIPTAIKNSIQFELHKRGISIDMLLNTNELEYDAEEISLSQTKLNLSKIYDKKQINKVIAHYKVSSIYFDRDSLYREIVSQYNSLFVEYESDARIWTFFYCDDLDTSHANWVCRGVCDSSNAYRVVWNNAYHTNRLMYQNQEISKKEAFERIVAITDKVVPLFEGMKCIIVKPDYQIIDLKEYVTNVHKEISDLYMNAQDIPFTDPETEKDVEKILGFIGEVALLFSDTYIYLHREEVNEKWIRYHAEHTIKVCSDKASVCFQIRQEYKLE